MFDTIENFKIISSLHRVNRPCNKIENRATHAFMIRTCGSILYDFEDRSILAKEGEMMFIPKGSCYSYRVLSDTAMFTSINFQADITEPRPTLFTLENFYEAEYIATSFADLWNFGTNTDKFKCYSLFFNLLSYLSSVENADYPEKRKFKQIDPAINYLKEHIYDFTLKTERLHRLCGISDTYFRKIFISRFGMTPQDYIISRRLSHAKSILDSGDFNTVREVALSVGYGDPLYFSKVFKKIYGISPSDLHP